MKKILLGFIAIGLLTFVGCEKEDDTDTTDNQTVNNTQTNSNNSSDDGSTDSDEETTDTLSDEAIDADGNRYKSVIIGEQEWFAENLKTSKYNDGTAIPNVTGNTEWNNLSTGAWSHYDNDNQYDTIYGKLYNWYAVETDKLCPTGWHVPTDAEWTVLEEYLAADGHSGKEGTALKATSGWDDYYEILGGGTDNYSWNGKPGGYRFSSGSFYNSSEFGSWWSATEEIIEFARNRGLHNYNGDISRDLYFKNSGFSVRCIKD